MNEMQIHLSPVQTTARGLHALNGKFADVGADQHSEGATNQPASQISSTPAAEGNKIGGASVTDCEYHYLARLRQLYSERPADKSRNAERECVNRETSFEMKVARSTAGKLMASWVFSPENTSILVLGH